MRKMSFLAFLLTPFLLVSCGANSEPSYSFNLKEKDGTVTTYTFTSSSEAKIEVKPVENYFFVGAFSEEKVDSKMVFDEEGKITSSYSVSTIPQTVYAIYSSLESIDYKSPTYNSENILSLHTALLSDDDGTVRIKIPAQLKKHFEDNPTSEYLLTPSFAHFEKESGVGGVNPSNWTEVKVSTGNDAKRIDTFYCDADNDWQVYSEDYLVTGEDLNQDYIQFLIKRTAANVSQNESKYKNFNYKIKAFSREEATFEEYGKKFTVVAQNGDFNIGSVAYPLQQELIMRIPDVVRVLAAKYEVSSVKVNFYVKSYGAKTLFFSNWGDVNFSVSATNGDNLFSFDCHFENNSSAKVNQYSSSMMASAITYGENVKGLFVYSSANASGKAQFISGVHMEYIFD